MDFYTRYAPPKSPTLKCDMASLTRQEFAEEADLNNIMEKYSAGLSPIPSGGRAPLFGDFSNIPDYQDSLQIVQDAQERFDQLPSKIRKEFDNDPGKLLDFLGDPANRPRAIELGLISDSEPLSAEKPAEKRPPEPSEPSA